MGDELVQFDLKGIGTRTSAKLHDAGVTSWAMLAEVLRALGGVRDLTSERLREMARQATERAKAHPGLGEPRDAERPLSFVVEVTMDAAGSALRSNVTDVRAQAEQPLVGWQPETVVRFIEEHAGLAAPPAPAPPETVSSVSSAGRRAGTGRPAAPDVDVDAGDHPSSVSLRAGRVVGGGSRTVDLLVDVTGAAAGPIEYQAVLELRPLGETTSTEVARTAGAAPASALALRFPDVTVPPGVHNLVVELDLGRSGPGATAAVREVKVA